MVTQWEDVGPFEINDVDYVFGSAEPENQRAGIDLSPALAEYLRIGGRGDVDWVFVEESEVADGPWKDIITRSNPDWP